MRDIYHTWAQGGGGEGLKDAPFPLKISKGEPQKFCPRKNF